MKRIACLLLFLLIACTPTPIQHYPDLKPYHPGDEASIDGILAENGISKIRDLFTLDTDDKYSTDMKIYGFYLENFLGDSRFDLQDKNYIYGPETSQINFSGITEDISILSIKVNAHKILVAYRISSKR